MMIEKEQDTNQPPSRDSLPSVDEEMVPILKEILDHMKEQNSHSKKTIRGLLGNNRRLVALLALLGLLLAVSVYQAVRMQRLVNAYTDAQAQLTEILMEVESTRVTVYDTAKKVDEKPTVDVVADEDDPEKLKIVVKKPPKEDKAMGTRKPPKHVEFLVDTPKSATVKEPPPKDEEDLESKK
jgi:hypothetical protein